MVEPVVVVHGGAWAVPEELWDESLQGVKAAARRGYGVLTAGGSSVDAAEASVVCLEDNPVFDAGTGSVLTFDEQVEMDAIIIDGTTMEAGAVGAIRNVLNPVKVARLVMEKTDHIMLVGDGANKFAAAHGVQEVDPEVLITSLARQTLAKYKKYTSTVYHLFNKTEKPETSGHETVGCVVVDREGHTSCATSTGGITAKMPGRVGDTPIVGAGGFADDQVGAVSTTGHGEAIMKACLARHITSVMGTGESVKSSIQNGLAHMESRIKGFGGAIAVSCKGEVGTHFSTPRMTWAYIQAGKLHYGIHPNQHVTEDL
ncbi:isoaspartyl peptidase/L-asparaginase-like [Homarus americanus]|uniref:isoaspartyl peptidase/L-asparaginase-like n=1 Tax=Homarus americanus TaxID=6706 RepID=UPI001C44E304|nr:isoaspartyl peptidase/L-asparaginase-like [Homarus americanus]XP_042234124.1 isoaspartyl peptidase/L-asparaginase-like [Homarus americanus]XP_042234125.1 isoaspartyl peptidase/L-asparaginase-like [Homarus americanus]XP_042234126.1 isoaspartyl peptidase/L-asparaginase-like [Homarus americanus]XP_042234127.1 isoaspartyl peptidase/L-asparaginase-like [Homarus americanus]